MTLVEAHIFLYKSKEDWDGMLAWSERALQLCRQHRSEDHDHEDHDDGDDDDGDGGGGGGGGGVLHAETCMAADEDPRAPHHRGTCVCILRRPASHSAG
eukprot:2996554-Rhodomonas_salina.1